MSMVERVQKKKQPLLGLLLKYKFTALGKQLGSMTAYLYTLRLAIKDFHTY
jgi:hypothetical protein